MKSIMKSRGRLLAVVAVVVAVIVALPVAALIGLGAMVARYQPAPEKPEPSHSAMETNPWTAYETPTGSGTETAAASGTVSPGPTATLPPDPVETKPGPATCQAAAAALAKAIPADVPMGTWRERMRPLVTGEIERVLPSVDTAVIPKGAPKVGEVIEQPGACDATLVWAHTAWRVAFVNQGSGWVASEWDVA